MVNLNKLYEIYGDGALVLGPYIWKKNGRKIVDVKTLDGKTKTMLFGRLVLEIKIGRKLLDNETVDHIDEDSSNDSPCNLQVLSRSDNAKKSCNPHNLISWVKDENNRFKMSEAKSGVLNVNSKLSEENISDIRSRNKFYGCYKLWAEEFNVTPVTISDAYNKRTYK